MMRLLISSNSKFRLGSYRHRRKLMNSYVQGTISWQDGAQSSNET